MSNEANGWPKVRRIGDILVKGGAVLGPRTIPDYELVYFPEATSTIYQIGDRPILLNEPGFVLTRPYKEHLYRFDPNKNVRHLFAHFDYEPFEAADSPYRPLLENGDWLPLGTNRLTASLMEQILRVSHAQGPRWKERISALLAAALEELRASADRSFEERPHLMPVQIAKAIAYMDKHLAKPLTIEDIASQTSWSHEHFTRVFSSIFGISPKRALLERRIRRAEQLMIAGKWTVKEIADQIGFGDVHHFSKMYKNVRGYPPSEYIKRSQDPLFRHMASAETDPETPYLLNQHIIVNQ